MLTKRQTQPTHMHLDTAFLKHLAHMDLEALGKSQDVIYIVDSKFTLMGFNDAWVAFAKNNNGESILTRYSLGKTIADVGNDPVRNYILKGYRNALESNTPFIHQYECPSSETYRVFHQTAYPIYGARGLVITHHLLIEKPHTEEGVAFSSRFENEHRVVMQCSNCRKIRDPRNANTWHWVPELVETPLPNISHGICAPCLDHYYPDIEE